MKNLKFEVQNDYTFSLPGTPLEIYLTLPFTLESARKEYTIVKKYSEKEKEYCGKITMRTGECYIEFDNIHCSLAVLEAISSFISEEKEKMLKEPDVIQLIQEVNAYEDYSSFSIDAYFEDEL
jgi:hypothetical protein